MITLRKDGQTDGQNDMIRAAFAAKNKYVPYHYNA